MATTTAPLPPATRSSLPSDAASVLELAARSMFDLFASASEGMLLVDRDARVVWINDQYRRFLPALGFAREEDFVGHPVSSVVQNTQMHQVLKTGKPILIDLLSNRAGTFVVSRIPLRDAEGEVIGVLGIVLFDQPTANLQPLIGKFAQLQQDLDDARRELAAKKSSSPSLARTARYSLASFIGTSPVAVEVKRQARRAAQSASPVLLLGETGTGKELLAHAIHGASSRAAGPMVSLNIAAVPDTLLEAEFFGVAPGAYTGADRKGRVGKFKLADGGTLFLDEIGDMPPGLQAKLLRALQEGEIEPLGSNQIVRFDARVIAATSRDLPALVREGRFREDLYYRLNVLPIRVPPLRERRSDIPALVETIGEDMAHRGVSPPELTADALALLAAQQWRGNIRELRNVLEQAALRSDASVLDAEQMEAVLRQSGLASVQPALPPEPQAPDSGALLRPLQEQIAELEQRAIAAALQATRGNKLAASRLLGVSRATLYNRLNPDAADLAP
ncbi:MAG TPA: sigma 54-interacting transcriptional regulator [Ottowia sp.]|uniref:sigma-54 interaction domain-containing protein n=3 Tax=Ottowia sp. TaxID=1898956 RepID=UPI002C4E6D98|nr:sigma 54-interacting transcriptional regulator [Ottowia sp.]HPK31923.1 sigma 54-interacting transcriptional regulator [Ottowia sp.]HPR45717.1 sigma 54-interacting transcriptional regulator [Ottowia sp.]HRW72977.1 sigma 54-interacting transcriptional regulator [Ottowia sp.]